jgi:uncharacterized protein (DUF2235 family)
MARGWPPLYFRTNIRFSQLPLGEAKYINAVTALFLAATSKLRNAVMSSQRRKCVKRIVICCDGTWNRPDQVHNGQTCASNVTKIARCIPPIDSKGVEQAVFYDKGVGTGRFDRLLGGGCGWGIKKKILDAYQFLMATYAPGDELFFFGFSRGAYTVRSIFGLIRNCGLLKPKFAHKLEDAYGLYRRRDAASHPDAVESELFRRTYSWEPGAKFIGVWDTVGALGLPVGGLLKFVNKRWAFHDMTLSSTVSFAYQALAIDEHRKPFSPSVWERSGNAPGTGQVLEQVWFAGVHSNVGGSYPNSGLSDITLEWMVNKATAAQCGLEIDVAAMKSINNPKPDPLGMIYNSQTVWYTITGMGNLIRPMGKGDAETAATSAVSRVNNQASKYDPKNLVEFLKSCGNTTVVP